MMFTLESNRQKNLTPALARRWAADRRKNEDKKIVRTAISEPTFHIDVEQESCINIFFDTPVPLHSQR